MARHEQRPPVAATPQTLRIPHRCRARVRNFLSPACPASTVTLAARIRKARKRSKLLQGKFARTLGVSQQTLSDWENGNGLRGVVAATAWFECWG